MQKRVLMFGFHVGMEIWYSITFTQVYYQQLGSKSFSTCQKCLCKVLSQSSQVNKQHFQTDWLSYMHWHKTLAAIITK